MKAFFQDAKDEPTMMPARDKLKTRSAGFEEGTQVVGALGRDREAPGSIGRNFVGNGPLGSQNEFTCLRPR